jgi:hypothetical protein
MKDEEIVASVNVRVGSIFEATEVGRPIEASRRKAATHMSSSNERKLLHPQGDRAPWSETT